jgi:hypothetical protein
MSKYDNINPSHYKRGSKEVWEMMVAAFGQEKYLAFCELNAFKYRMRAGSKPTSSVEEDIQKAQWYESQIDKLI